MWPLQPPLLTRGFMTTEYGPVHQGPLEDTVPPDIWLAGRQTHEQVAGKTDGGGKAQPRGQVNAPRGHI